MTLIRKKFAYIKHFAVSFLIMILVVHSSFSQELKKDVTVVKSYQPVIFDANKINFMPVFKDTVAVIPHFEYSIYPVQLNTVFRPRPMSAAKMAQEPLPVLNNNYLKLGIGNHLATVAELNISNSRSKENSYGLILKHHGIDGKVVLDNDKKADAPFAFNEAAFYGKHIFKESELS